MKTKICKGCKKRKSVKVFTKKAANKDGLNSRCRVCTRSGVSKHYEENKGYYFDRNRRRKNEARTWLNDFKSTLKCNRCPESHPPCLEFHHSDPTAKEATVADMYIKGWGRERMLKELKKCEVLCANCHRKEHFPPLS